MTNKIKILSKEMQFFLQNIIILIILYPLVFGIIFIAINKAKFSKYIFAISNTILTIFILIAFYKLNIYTKEYSYVTGGVFKSIGIELLLNFPSAMMILLIYISLIIYSLVSLRGEVSNMMYGLILILTTGLSGLTLTNDIFNMYVFFELSSITSYIIYSSTKEGHALKYTLDYLIISSISSILMLLSIFILYKSTGHLNITMINKQLYILGVDQVTKAAYILMILSWLLKLGFYPLHNIVFRIYSELSTKFIVFTIGTVSSIYLFTVLKLIYHLFGFDFIKSVEIFNTILKLFASIGIITIGLILNNEKQTGKFIAFLSIEQTSYVLFCSHFMHNNKNMYYGIIIGIFANSLSKVGLIAIINAAKKIVKSNHDITIEELSNIVSGLRIYRLFICLFLAVIIGLPLSLGFISKMIIFKNLFSNGATILNIILLLCGILLIASAILKYINTIMIVVKKEHLDIYHKYNFPLLIALMIILIMLFTSFILY